MALLGGVQVGLLIASGLMPKFRTAPFMAPISGLPATRKDTLIPISAFQQQHGAKVSGLLAILPKMKTAALSFALIPIAKNYSRHNPKQHQHP
jgi:hypothetical protein